MTALDPADLVVIAGRALGIGTDAALAQMDIAAARDALAAARPHVPGPGPGLGDRAVAAAAGIGLVQALLRHRPFPGHGQQVAVAAGLQFLSLNGWRADLNPAATAAVVVEALASGRLTSDDAAAWLSPRLSPAPRASQARRAEKASRAGRASSAGRAGKAGRAPRPGRPGALPPARAGAGRAAAGVLLAGAVTGAALLAAACSRAPDLPASPSGVTTCAAAHHVGPAAPAGSRPGGCPAPGPSGPSR